MRSYITPGPLFALLALFLVAGGILLNIFVILSGVVSTTPMPHIYFLSADTSAITGAPATSAWTYFALCSKPGDETTDCGPVKAAFTFNPVGNFGTSTGVPPAFIG